MLSLESPRKPKNIVHRISDQQKPEKDQKKDPQTPTSPPKSSGTVNKEEKILNFINSMKTHQQLTIAVGNDNIVYETMAKNILAARTRLGKFKSLNQVSATAGMDPTKERRRAARRLRAALLARPAPRLSNRHGGVGDRRLAPDAARAATFGAGRPGAPSPAADAGGDLAPATMGPRTALRRTLPPAPAGAL